MTSDLRALLAAIVANPADDTARLVYADCLQENGNFARAEFIRLQIEAERHHPDSNARSELERRARELLAEHWIDWWGEMCSAVGFPLPTPKPSSRLGRFASRVGLRSGAGYPYQTTGFQIIRSYDPRSINARSIDALRGLAQVIFRRGFPDTVEIHDNPAPFLPKWSLTSPLHTLTVDAPYSTNWYEGQHLANLHSLILHDYDLVVFDVLQSPHFTNLKSLYLGMPGYLDNPDPLTIFADELAALTTAPRTRQLTRLAITVWSDRAAEIVASAESLSGLESLEVSLMTDNSDEGESAGWRLAILSRSPHLAGLKELTVNGVLNAAGIAAAIQKPTWTGLRKLELDLQFSTRLDCLDHPDGLPMLEDFTLAGININAEEIAVFLRSPLLKRLTHFTLRGHPNNRTLLSRLIDAVDANRIETFSLALPITPATPLDGVAQLRRHFGDKLRVTTG
ncbi:MAG: TIGR02996 domain-containing protein [Planctomycetia bacterium]|nr:TIGR02996 domain-containing protein [Planctomycetia bacterium]